MKHKDQQLLEEAYKKTYFIEEGSLEDFNDNKVQEETESKLKQQYLTAAKEYNKVDSSMNSTQFGDICAMILGELWGNEPSKHNPSTTGEDFEKESRAVEAGF